VRSRAGLTFNVSQKKMIDPKWDRIVDQTIITLAVMFILFGMLAGMMIEFGHFEVSFGQERKLVSAQTQPLVFWSLVAALIAVSVGSAITAGFRIKKRIHEEG